MIQMTPGHYPLPKGGAVSGAGVCPKSVVRGRVRASVPGTGLPAVWQRAARIDFTAIPSASSGRVT